MNNTLLWRATKAVFVREVRSELRSRQALNAVALFAVCSIVAVSSGLVRSIAQPNYPSSMLHWFGLCCCLQHSLH